MSSKIIDFETELKKLNCFKISQLWGRYLKKYPDLLWEAVGIYGNGKKLSLYSYEERTTLEIKVISYIRSKKESLNQPLKQKK